MQPSYLPWSGYFNLIMNSDVFVFLDDAQYSKNSFFSRNRYPSSSKDGFSWLTVPVRRLNSTQLFNEIYVLDEEKWRKKHLLTFKHVYGKAPMYDKFYPFLEAVISNAEIKVLSDLNIGLIKSISSYLGINTEMVLSSQLGITGSRSEKLEKICKTLGCDTYLSPGGAQDYIEEDNILPESGIKIIYQKYNCTEYDQGSNQFVPYMSIIDILFRYDVETSKKILFQKLT